MKRLFFLVGVIAMGVLPFHVQAQKLYVKRKFLQPSYSINNYKHPRHAKAAMERHLIDASVKPYQVEKVRTPFYTRDNYKVNKPTVVSNRQYLIVPSKKVKRISNPMTSDRNYKRQIKRG